MEDPTKTTITDFATLVGYSVAARDSNFFVPLTSRIITAQFETALTALLDDGYTEAQDRIDSLNDLGLGYQLVRYPDPHHETLITGFVESARPGTPQYRGWGGVLVRSAGSRRRVYQAPHVLFDTHTLEVALRAFVDDPGGAALLVAGAHRYANGEDRPIADVTRSSSNVFHALTAYLAHTAQSRGTPLWFIQFHGSLDRRMQPMITASNGADAPRFTKEDPLVQIKQRVEKRSHLAMGVCGWRERTGEPYLLCGKENIQGLLLERMGLRSTFLHFELERRLRDDFYNGVEPGYTGMLEYLATVRDVLDLMTDDRKLTADE